MSGLQVVCMASGPSLCAEDVARVRTWREAAADRAVYVTNTTFRLAPWADVLYAHDQAWWKHYTAEVDAVFGGERISARAGCLRYGATILPPHFPSCHNSGADAVSLAIFRGASRVVMLGYDCQHTGGKTHWHGNHPPGLGDAVSIKKWPAKFAGLVGRAGGRIVNASRETALTVFPRVSLEEALA